MIANDKTERIRSIIGWMRKNITLSLEGYRPGWERASKFSIGSSLPFDGDDTSAPSIGRVGGWSDGATVRPCLRRVKLTQDLPPAASRDVKKIPDLKRENPSFAAMLVKYVNERFGVMRRKSITRHMSAARHIPRLRGMNCALCRKR